MLEQLFDSDEQTDGSPVLTDENRRSLLEWLQRVLVDRDALFAHIRVLQRQAGLCRHSQPLPEDLAALVVKGAVTGLGSLGSSDLATLC